MQQLDLSLDTLVYLDWVDSHFLEGWRDKGVKGDILHVQTVGFVTENEDTHLTVTTSLTEDGGIMCPLTIPWCCVEKAIELKIPE